MNTKKRTIIGILAMIIVLAVSAGCLFGCGKSDDDEKESDKKQSQKADDDEDEDDEEDDDEDDKKSSKKSKKDDDEDEDEDEDGYEAVVKKYMDAYKKGDAKKIIALMPEKFVEKSIEIEFDGDEDAMIQGTQDSFDTLKEKLEVRGYKLSKLKYEIEDVEDLDEDEIEEIIDEIEDEYEIRLKIKEAKTVEISTRIPAEDKSMDDAEETQEITLIKIGSSWHFIFR